MVLLQRRDVTTFFYRETHEEQNGIGVVLVKEKRIKLHSTTLFCPCPVPWSCFHHESSECVFLHSFVLVRLSFRLDPSQLHFLFFFLHLLEKLHLQVDLRIRLSSFFCLLPPLLVRMTEEGDQGARQSYPTQSRISPAPGGEPCYSGQPRGSSDGGGQHNGGQPVLPSVHHGEEIIPGPPCSLIS